MLLENASCIMKLYNRCGVKETFQFAANGFQSWPQKTKKMRKILKASNLTKAEIHGRLGTLDSQMALEPMTFFWKNNLKEERNKTRDGNLLAILFINGSFIPLSLSVFADVQIERNVLGNGGNHQFLKEMELKKEAVTLTL
jgi:hypothetical protein